MYSNQHNLYNSIQQHHDSTPHNDHYSYQTTEPRSNHPSQFFDTQHSSGHSQSPLIDFEIPSHAEPEPESDTCYYAPYSPDYDSGYSVNTSDNEDRDPLNWQPPIIETDFTNIDEALELKLNTADSLYRLFKAGKLKVQVGPQQRWAILCPDCDEWCQTSTHSSIALWIEGQFIPLRNHRGSKKCAQTVTNKQKQHVRNVSDEPTPRSLVAFSHQKQSTASRALP
ncbi:hypothetical protein DFJ58DRAFT_732295 [Suillus subalutaceus]|uniref:uncharacterized protein n=1 Tax=Suillus subalutaceus TaxID=48586 RepID=UPI001B861496|nr:uncharacterized protein DFJ58DRAFT_732295 [Suillus subalutaceus]KAG1841792.1 hypothetical protein DFJ58DRAFT_732295 [Suillus subalutaceus]